MNAASVVSTSSSSHRNVRMMFDMMPSDPLPAITFSDLQIVLARKHLAKIEAAVRIQIQVGERAPPWPPRHAATVRAGSRSRRV